MNIECGECGNRYPTTYSGYRQGNRCRKCATKKNTIRKSHSQEFVNAYIAKYGDKLLDKYVNGSTKIKIKCGSCNKIFRMRFHTYKNKGCRCLCRTMSKGERAVDHYLTHNNISYETQKTFNGCKNKIALGLVLAYKLNALNVLSIIFLP